jgi:superfamily II DNA or RNA helicase
MIENGEEIKETIIKMGLDNSQKKALNHALDSNFALIQGPPGTGKTYIGVQIVRLLIKYKSYWNQEGPILLVTYTNHALEQFLHLIKDITNKIVRIGGK